MWTWDDFTAIQVFHQANLDRPVYSERSGFFRKTIGLAEILNDEFSAIASEIEFALVLGSIANGRAKNTFHRYRR